MTGNKIGALGIVLPDFDEVSRNLLYLPLKNPCFTVTLLRKTARPNRNPLQMNHIVTGVPSTLPKPDCWRLKFVLSNLFWNIQKSHLNQQCIVMKTSPAHKSRCLMLLLVGIRLLCRDLNRIVFSWMAQQDQY